MRDRRGGSNSAAHIVAVAVSVAIPQLTGEAVAWVLFIAIKAINKLKKDEPAAPSPEPTQEVKLLTEIRDLLKNRAPLVYR